jgi:DNA-binding CsgD family transcriptional regulator
VSTKLSAIIGQYRNILATDGIVDKEELIEMLKVDTEIIVKDYNKLADKILDNIEELKAYALPVNKKQAEKDRMKLYKQGLSDEEIALIEGVTSTTIYSWRKVRKLSTNLTKLQREKAEKYEKRLEFYNQGLTDKEIAENCNEKVSTIKGWRERNKLTANSDTIKEKCLKMLDEGCGVKEVSESQNICSTTLYKWKSRRKKANAKI